MKKYWLIALLFSCSNVHGSNTPQVVLSASQVIISSYGVTAGATIQVIIATPPTNSPYSTGYSNYLTELHIVDFATGNLNGQALPFLCTMTGFPTGTIQIPMPTNQSAGVSFHYDLTIQYPIQAIPATQIVINCAGEPNVIWNIWAGYQVGP